MYFSPVSISCLGPPSGLVASLALVQCPVPRTWQPGLHRALSDFSESPPPLQLTVFSTYLSNFHRHPHCNVLSFLGLSPASSHPPPRSQISVLSKVCSKPLLFTWSCCTDCCTVLNDPGTYFFSLSLGFLVILSGLWLLTPRK